MEKRAIGEVKNRREHIMSGVETMACEECRNGGSRLSAGEIAELLPEIPGWESASEDGVPHLVRTFTFPDFRRALDFTLSIGELAEREDHHPRLVTEWGRVRVEWWTHSIGGLHRNDFIMAARTSSLHAG
jgi:4a-hydroxytetrahydrobiopterin dehydratase